MSQPPAQRGAGSTAMLVRELRIADRRRLAILDDDPTGSQAVHGVAMLVEPDPVEAAAALAEPGSTCFVLTNTRSMPEAAATELTYRAALELFALEASLGGPVDVLSRGDSTLRGHIVAEMQAIDQARRDALGAGYDGFLLCPAYIEAGRVTVDDVHLARVGDAWVPVGETEFAADATFGYRASDLKLFLAERSDGRIAASETRSIGSTDIRAGGVGRVASLLRELSGGWVVVNATSYADLDVVALAMLQAEGDGTRLLARGGPSLARSMAGVLPRGRVAAAELTSATSRSAHGLVVAGSHVGLTGRQLERLKARGSLVHVELDAVQASDDDAQREAHVAEVAARVASALGHDDVLLATSRQLLRGIDRDDSLRIARAVSMALVDVVARVRGERPAWVVAKGGITSHDVARRGLGIRRAQVLGQLGDGIVTVVRPVSGPPETLDMPYVIFAGNVGDDETLAEVVDILREAS